MSLFRSSAWGALSLQRSLPLAPAGAPVPSARSAQRHTLPRPRTPGRTPSPGAAADAHAIPAVLTREPDDGR